MTVGTILLAVRVALAVVLYGFLGWVLLTLWRELQTQSSSLASRRVPPISLFGIGPQNKSRHQFNHSKITIGRNPACDCMVDDDTVSAFLPGSLREAIAAKRDLGPEASFGSGYG